MEWITPQFVASVLTGLVMFGVLLGTCAYLIFIERKVAAWTQDRIGPNRTNFSFGILPFKGKHFGLGQAVVDGIKLFLKEDYTPQGVDRGLFLLAPMLAVVPAIVSWAVIPWGGYLRWNGQALSLAAAPLALGVVYILAVGSLSVYAVVLGGYASNNKYSFLGGLRAAAQMLSYEIPMGLCVLVIILSSGGALSAEALIFAQANGVWNLLRHPMVAVVFFTCILAETNRAPFDLAEAEQELVGGYHTEYSSMKWAYFFLGEYMHMITGSAFFCLLFLGGWDLPLLQEPQVGGLGWVLVKALAFALKIGLLIVVMMWIRWTLPRFRFDQLMRLAWRSLIPLILLMLLVTGVMVYREVNQWWWHLVADLAVLAGVLVLGAYVPQGPPVNRKLALHGSRFSPPNLPPR